MRRMTMDEKVSVLDALILQAVGAGMDLMIGLELISTFACPNCPYKEWCEGPHIAEDVLSGKRTVQDVQGGYPFKEGVPSA